MIYGVRPAATALMVGAADTVEELIGFYETEDAVSQGMLLTTDDLIVKASLRQLIFVPLIIQDDGSQIDRFCGDHKIAIVEWPQLLAHQRRLVRDTQDDDHPLYMRTPTIAERHGLAALTDVTHEALLAIINKEEKGLEKFEADSRRVREASIMAKTGKIETRPFVMFAVCEETHPADADGPGILAYFVHKTRFIDRNDKAVACPDDLLTELPATFGKLQTGVFRAPSGLDAEATRRELLGLGYHPDPSIRACFQGGDPNLYRDREHRYRLDILKADTASLEQAWPQYALKAARKAAFSETTGDTVSYVFDTHAVAARVKQATARKGWTVRDIYLVNDQNKPVVLPEGGTLQQLPETPIRPWNYRREDYALLTAEERRALHKTFKAAEFSAAVGRGPDGKLHVLIAPSTHFARKGDLFQEPLEIGHLLPQGFEELSPGHYIAPGADVAALQKELSETRRFFHDMLLQVKANEL